MTNQARFTINSLLEGKSALVHITPVAPDGTLLGSPAPGLQGSKGLGLEIENIAALPDAGIIRSTNSILPISRRPRLPIAPKSPKQRRLSGLLAAKRAIVKSGAVSNPRKAIAASRSVSMAKADPPIPAASYRSVIRRQSPWPFVFGLASLPGRRRLPLPQPEGSRSPPNTEIFAQNQDFCVSGFVVVVGSLRIGLWKVLEFLPH